MVKRRIFTHEEKQQIVEGYLDAPHGKKGSYLNSIGLSRKTIMRWRTQLAIERAEAALNNDPYAY